jgi:hypothetical protein
MPRDEQCIPRGLLALGDRGWYGGPTDRLELRAGRQVDSEYKDAFGPEATHMVKCAADCLGILFASYNSLAEFYCQGVLYQRQCELHEQTISSLCEERDELNAKLVNLNEEINQLKRPHGADT